MEEYFLISLPKNYISYTAGNRVLYLLNHILWPIGSRYPTRLPHPGSLKILAIQILLWDQLQQFAFYLFRE
jgi:hypothetical protein